MPEPVIVVPYDPSWPVVFEDLRSRLIRALGDLAMGIEHVGSTAVPGLAAKPIIDVDVVIASASDLCAAIELLATIGYAHRGDLGVTGREAFSQPPELPRHHLYVCTIRSVELLRHLLFRDYLRTHPDEVIVYERIKQDAAVRFPQDREAYTEAKTATVKAILRRALLAADSPCAPL